MRNIKILFVKSGSNVPYPPLEQGIAESLRKVSREVIVASPNEDLLKLAEKVKPDLVLVFSGVQLLHSQVAALNGAGFKSAIWLTDDPYYTDLTKKIASYYDFVFTQEINCIYFYKLLGCRNVYHLPLAADPNVYYPRSVDSKYKVDILFVGSAFWNRVRFFDKMADYLSSQNVLISGLWWDRLVNYQMLKKKIRLNHWINLENPNSPGNQDISINGWMYPKEIANYYSGSKIVINMHRSHEDQSFNQNSQKVKALSINLRTFEISACGAFQLTDIRQDLNKFYKPGYDIATYNTPDELIEKIEYYLVHEEERKSMASRALNRIQNEHTFLNRVSHLLDIVFPKEVNSTCVKGEKV
jgi:spore maturation protein CgeB